MRARTKEIFEEVHSNISWNGMLPSESDTINYDGLISVLVNCLNEDLCGKEYIAYLSSTNPYKNIKIIKEVRDKIVTKTREVLINELKDVDRVDNILSGLK